MAGWKKELIGKRFHAEGKVFTVYAVSAAGVFAHEGDVMETTEEGEVVNPRYFEYKTVESNLVKAGRPSVGTTRRVSLTLPDEIWGMIDRRKETWGSTQAQTLRMMIEGYFFNNDESKDE